MTLMTILQETFKIFIATMSWKITDLELQQHLQGDEELNFS